MNIFERGTPRFYLKETMFDELLRCPRGSAEKRLETEGESVEEALFHALCVCENS